MSKAIITLVDADDGGTDINIEYVDGRDDKADAHYWATSIYDALNNMIKYVKENKDDSQTKL